MESQNPKISNQPSSHQSGSSFQDLPEHIQSLISNIDEVKTLLNIHEKVAGSGPGYKHNVEVLNKSCIVLLVACLEAFIEDIAIHAFDMMLSESKDSKKFPIRVRVIASATLKKDLDESAVWKLADNGWREILILHKDQIHKQFIGNFNTPKSEKIDKFFYDLIGLEKLSKHWHWKSMSTEQAAKKLNDLVDLRGDIAHRVQGSSSVGKALVADRIYFIYRLAAEIHNSVTMHLKDVIGRYPWMTVRYRNPKKLGSNRRSRKVNSKVQEE